MARIIQLFTVLFELDGQDLLGLLRLGKPFAQLLLRPLLHIHVIVIFELPVIVIADARRLGGFADPEAFFGAPEEMDSKSKNKSAQLADDNNRKIHSQLKS